MIVSNFVLRLNSRLLSMEETKYSLQITNLEDKAIDFIIECHITPPEGESSPSWYLTNSIEFSINPGQSLQMPSFHQGSIVILRQFITIGAGISALFNMSQTANDGKLIKGFIVLRVPPSRSSQSRFFLSPQTDHPVRVLLHARREDIRWSAPYASDMDGNYVMKVPSGLEGSSEAVAISTGRAENEIPPEGTLMFTPGLLTSFHSAWIAGDLKPDKLVGAHVLAENERALTLMDLLLGLTESTEDIDALNRILAEAGSAIRIRPVEKSSKG